jgi:methyl-accepting chemotaxis protein
MDKNKGLTLKARLYVMLGSMLLGLILLGGYSVFELRTHILEEKKLALEALVDSGVGVIQEQYDLFKAGKLTEEEAQRLAKDNLRKSKYHNGADYFHLRPERRQPRMPRNPNGGQTLDTKDPNGKYYIKEWTDLLKRTAAPYDHVSQGRPRSDSRVLCQGPAMGLVAGTVYIEDVDADFNMPRSSRSSFSW